MCRQVMAGQRLGQYRLFAGLEGLMKNYPRTTRHQARNIDIAVLEIFL